MEQIKRSILDTKVGDLLFHDHEYITEYNYVFNYPILLIIEPLTWIRFSLNARSGSISKFDHEKNNEKFIKSLCENLYLIEENVKNDFLTIRNIIIKKLIKH